MNEALELINEDCSTRQELNSGHEVSTSKQTKEQFCQREATDTDRNRLKRGTEDHALSTVAITQNAIGIDKSTKRRKMNTTKEVLKSSSKQKRLTSSQCVETAPQQEENIEQEKTVQKLKKTETLQNQSRCYRKTQENTATIP